MSDASIVEARAPQQSDTNEIAGAIESCRDALDAPDIREATRAIRASGYSESDCIALIEQAGREPGSSDRVVQLRGVLSADLARSAAVERYLLLVTIARYSDRLAQAFMSDSVLRCLAEELRFVATPFGPDAARLLAPSDGFTAMAKVVTLRRFPAGQLHFELSGIPLSWLLRLGPRRLTKVLVFLASHGRGRRPFFFHHIAWRRKNRLFLSQLEQNRSYFRIAQSLALHPEVKGILTESWLHSPETFRISPHLAWLNRPFLDHGGLVVEIGAASETSGVFTGSRERKRLYDEGKFRPTTAMAVWPRAAVLDWAMSHPELAD